MLDTLCLMNGWVGSRISVTREGWREVFLVFVGNRKNRAVSEKFCVSPVHPAYDLTLWSQWCVHTAIKKKKTQNVYSAYSQS